MKGINGLKKILELANNKLNIARKDKSGKIQIRLVDPNRLNHY